MLGDGYVVALVLQRLAVPHCNVASFHMHVHLVVHRYLICGSVSNIAFQALIWTVHFYHLTP